MLFNHETGEKEGESGYSTNWTYTLDLFEELIQLQKGDTLAYQKSFDLIVKWFTAYPLKTNKWGPMYEDVTGWSDTQSTAVTFAWYMLKHTTYFPNWKKDVTGIFDWVYKELGNDMWKSYGVTVVNEQTAFRYEGNSHTSRQASVELLYDKLRGEHSHYNNAVRQLIWATYMVNERGENQYPVNEIWLSDSYGDYIRHYIRAMAVCPELAPDNENHLLESTSVIQDIEYFPHFKFNPWAIAESEQQLIAGKNHFTRIWYKSYDKNSTELFRLTKKPVSILVDTIEIAEKQILDSQSWTWLPLESGGILRISHNSGKIIRINY